MRFKVLFGNKYQLRMYFINIQGNQPKKQIQFPFFFPQFQLGNHTGYCIEKIPLHLILDFICIGKTPHTHTHTHTHKVPKLYLTLTRKINATY